MTDQKLAANFDEIRDLLGRLPERDETAEAAVEARQAELTKPPGSLGRLETLVVWLAAWQRRVEPRVERPHTAVFAGNHGVADRGVSAYPAAVTEQMVKNFIDGGAAVNQLCALVDGDLRVYEMALHEPTRDFAAEPAMSEEDCVTAMCYGMMAVEPGLDILAVGEMGIANTTSAAAICHALYGGAAADWVGRGTGIDDARLQRKIATVEQAVALHAAGADQPFEVLRCLGGREIAAISGAIIAARMAGIPVLIDGFAATAAAAVLHAAAGHALDHCQVAHLSAEPGHRGLVEKIGKRAILDLDMRLGEATGATLAILILKAAVACHNGMATFAEAGVSGPSGPS